MARLFHDEFLVYVMQLDQQSFIAGTIWGMLFTLISFLICLLVFGIDWRRT